VIHQITQDTRPQPISPPDWGDDDWVTLSALQHYSYCPRQFALIYKEQTFHENLYTMKGRLAHEKVDDVGTLLEDGIPVLRALSVWSDRYGLQGKCDVVELRDGQPYPVEYKHGRQKASIHDDVQLCAQALCLEEMFATNIPFGAIYHISSRRRRIVSLTETLREHVIDLAQEVRILSTNDILPPAVHDNRCRDCSLQEACMPSLTNASQPIMHWSEIMEEEKRHDR